VLRFGVGYAATLGPVITMFEYEPAPGVKINKIVNLSDDLALALRAISVRYRTLVRHGVGARVIRAYDSVRP
jgi:DNA segregation ATPase FtsK/SpoIIIE-like protein